MRDPESSDPGRVADAVLTASRALVAVAARSLLAVDETVTLPQFRALVVLASRGPQLMGELAEQLGVHQSTATRLCDRLVGKGLVERMASPTSRREVQVGLTDEGARVVRVVSERRRTEIADIVARIPSGERSSIVSALRVFGRAAGEVPHDYWVMRWE